MSQDLRLYSLSLLFVVLLWTMPARADYGAGSECPTLAIPVLLNDDDVWHSGNKDDGDWEDLRDLYPASGTEAYITTYSDENGNYLEDCSLFAGAGTYYDKANHLWVLDDDLSCDFMGSGEDGDFRTGYDY